MSGLLAVLLLLVLVKLGQGAYRWYAYGDEREQIREISVRLEDSGVEVVRTRLAIDSTLTNLASIDSQLVVARERVSTFEQWGERGTLPPHLYGGYRLELESYNRQVTDRNARLGSWEELIARNHAAVAEYNLLADSLRRVAARMGEPFYPVPSPVELAVRRGLIEGGSN